MPPKKPSTACSSAGRALEACKRPKPETPRAKPETPRAKPETPRPKAGGGSTQPQKNLIGIKSVSESKDEKMEEERKYGPRADLPSPKSYQPRPGLLEELEYRKANQSLIRHKKYNIWICPETRLLYNTRDVATTPIGQMTLSGEFQSFTKKAAGGAAAAATKPAATKPAAKKTTKQLDRELADSINVALGQAFTANTG